MAGALLELSGWLHAVRARIAAPCNETPTCLDSTGKGKVIEIFVVSQELHVFLKEVAADDSPTFIRTHRPVVLTLEGVKRGRLVQRLCRLARLSRVVTVGPSRRPPSYVVVLDIENVRRAAPLGRRGAHSAGRGGLAVET